MNDLTIFRLAMTANATHFTDVNERFAARGGYLRAYLAGYLLTLASGSLRA